MAVTFICNQTYGGNIRMQSKLMVATFVRDQIYGGNL